MDKIVLVTGGSRGIGAATALLAARQGWAVAVNYTRDASAADEVVRQINAMPGGRAGTPTNSPSSRPQASRTFTTDCHCDTTGTSGASMRPPRMDATIIIPPPPFSSLCSSSQHPSPSSMELSVFCSNLEMA